MTCFKGKERERKRERERERDNSRKEEKKIEEREKENPIQNHRLNNHCFQRDHLTLVLTGTFRRRSNSSDQI